MSADWVLHGTVPHLSREQRLERERERGTRGRQCPKIHSFDICVLLDSVLMARLSSTPLRFLLRAAVKKKRVVGTGGGKKHPVMTERKRGPRFGMKRKVNNMRYKGEKKEEEREKRGYSGRGK